MFGSSKYVPANNKLLNGFMLQLLVCMQPKQYFQAFQVKRLANVNNV